MPEPEVDGPCPPEREVARRHAPEHEAASRHAPGAPARAAGPPRLAAACVDPVERIVDQRLPLHVLPSMRRSLEDFRRTIPASDFEGRRRLASYEAALGDGASRGAVTASSWKRDPAGRIHLVAPSIQSIARELRRHIVPSRDAVFLDIDLVNAHAWIAAARSGDERLLEELRRGDLYEALARRHLPAIATDQGRRAIKPAALSLLCGGSVTTVAGQLRTLVDPVAAREIAEGLVTAWWAEHPDLQQLCTEVRNGCEENRGAPVRVVTLTGRERVFSTSGRGAWRKALWGNWACVEAEIVDEILIHLDDLPRRLGVRLVMPMFDGLLVEASEGRSNEAAREISALAAECATRAGVPGLVVKVDVQRAWGVAMARP